MGQLNRLARLPLLLSLVNFTPAATGPCQTWYQTKDVAVRGSHGGAFMFRGIAVEVRVPLSSWFCLVTAL